MENLDVSSIWNEVVPPVAVRTARLSSINRSPQSWKSIMSRDTQKSQTRWPDSKLIFSFRIESLRTEWKSAENWDGLQCDQSRNAGSPRMRNRISGEYLVIYFCHMQWMKSPPLYENIGILYNHIKQSDMNILSVFDRFTSGWTLLDCNLLYKYSFTGSVHTVRFDEVTEIDNTCLSEDSSLIQCDGFNYSMKNECLWNVLLKDCCDSD
jgi:hypothetical protein